ncbi:MAG: hypothetical protein LBL01_06565 [Bifidobacteriaceae bacterium]|nr:hypothetical protein [Bifidobacteriaceae bacterium]
MSSGAGFADSSTAAYPFRYSYALLLSWMFRLTGTGLGGVVALNTLLDVVAAWAIGYLVFLMTRSRKWQAVGLIAWWLSPFNIVYCALSMSHVAANTAVAVVFVCAAWLTKNLGHLPRVAAFGVALGVACRLEDVVRPVAAVLMIAVALYLGVEALARRSPRIAGNAAVAMAAVVASFWIAGLPWAAAVSSATGEPYLKNPNGWALFVGSSYESNGGYNREDVAVRSQVAREEGGDEAAINAELRRMAVDRWRELGPAKAAELLVAKSVRLSGDQQDMIQPLWYTYSYFDERPNARGLLKVANACYWFAVLGCSLAFLYRRRFDGRPDFATFLGIAGLGLYAGSLLPEVQGRYFMILMPVFTVLAVLGLRQTTTGAQSCSHKQLAT